MVKSKPRSKIVLDMILHSKGGSMRHCLDRRSKELKNIRHYIDGTDDEENDDEALDDEAQDAYPRGVEESE